MRSASVLVLTLCCLEWVPARAADFEPDPRSVQRHGPAYRYPQAGWIVLHIEGEPYERGVQHGRLLAPEIAAYVRCFAACQSSKGAAESWKLTRTLVNSLFLRRYGREYLEEMKGIADGASAAGAKFDGRPLDLTDIVALNAWSEFDTLDNALDALPTGLEGVRFPKEMPRQLSKPKPMHCSAFAATGPATKDGKIVFGHITMYSLYPGNFYNVWLDVKPAKGRRVLMQTSPGGIYSGMDYYLNDAGLLVSETTIDQTRFDAKGCESREPALFGSGDRGVGGVLDMEGGAAVALVADGGDCAVAEWRSSKTPGQASRAKKQRSEGQAKPLMASGASNGPNLPGESVNPFNAESLFSLDVES